MVEIRREIRFLLNNRAVSLPNVRASETLLDFLRLDQRLRGTKEGCAEGDCGACTVLVGRLLNGELIYETVNACIRFTGSLDACHVVTVEHLKGTDGELHPVQQALVDHHGSQCGFCTPGIVMSLYKLWMGNPRPTDHDIEKALQGNLCRCTGYAPIVRAARAASNMGNPGSDRLRDERGEVRRTLSEMRDGKRVECGPENDRLIIPADVDDLASVLEERPGATIVAGSTDVGLWVTKFMREISPAVFVGNLMELQHIEVNSGRIKIGAGVTYSQLYATIEKEIPQLAAFWERIGGEQVRNMGTIGGNVANGSPIGDTPPPLIALGASVTLRKGGKRRTIPVEDFFVAYGKQDREPGEFVESLEIPLPGKNDRFAAYKISKRRDEDISSVCVAIMVSVSQDNTITSARIAYGGMAATPKRAKSAEQVLAGTQFDETTFEAARLALEADFKPISDWRASAAYRMLSAKNLLRRFWLENRPDGGPATIHREKVAEGQERWQ